MNLRKEVVNGCAYYEDGSDTNVGSIEKAIKNLREIVELVKEEIDKNNENTTATLDLEDLKSLQIVINKIESEDKKNAGKMQ